MIAPSISFDDAQVEPLWAGLSHGDVKEMIRCDVAILNDLRRKQSEAAKLEDGPRRVEEHRLNLLITGWESAQDAHFSWLKEIVDAESTRSPQWPAPVGPGPLGQGS